MTDLAVAVVQANRNQMANLTIDPIAAFGIVAKQANSLAKGANADARIIIAPEYFLNARLEDDEDTPEVMTRREKHQNYRSLERVSEELGDTIIVAGTIFYRKGRFRKTGLNVCPILQNGQIIHKYYKVFDDYTLRANIPKARFRSKDTSPIFDASGIRFGIEVCGDMVNTAARTRNWGDVKNSGAVQVHILIADGGGISRNDIQAGAGGAMIMTDLQSGQTSVLRSDTNEWKPNIYSGKDPVTKLKAVNKEGCQATGVKIKVFKLDGL